MHAVYSFFSKPFLSSGRKAQGKLDEHFFYQCWILTVLLAKRIFPEVHLVTDDEGKKILIDLLELPFDSVSLDLNDIQHIPSELWAYGKIIAYQKQTKPFLHLDYDVFLFEQLPSDIYSAEIIVESKELFTDFIYYKPNHKFLKEQKYESPFSSSLYSLNHAFNCGVFGGRNLPTISQYCAEARRIVHFVNRKMVPFNSLPVIHRRLFSIVFEQSCLASVTLALHVPVFQLLTNPSGADVYGYTHLKGTKEFPWIRQRITSRLQKEFPGHFNRYLFKTIASNPKNRQYHENIYH